MIRQLWGRPCEQMTDTAGSLPPYARPREYSSQRPLRLAWSGLHLGRKALPILLEAMASLRDAPLQLIVAGAGGETARWQALAWKLRISEKIRWLGHLPPDRLRAGGRDSHREDAAARLPAERNDGPLLHQARG